VFPPLSIVDRGDTKISDEDDGCERPDTLPSEKPPPEVPTWEAVSSRGEYA
jgi:hypothetical protein